MGETVNLVRKARAVSVPIIAITTPDAKATIASLLAEEDVMSFEDGAGEMVPGAGYSWDLVDGLVELNDAALQAGLPDGIDQIATVGEAGILEALRAARKGAGAIYFVHNAHRLLEGQGGEVASASQAIANVRDDFKSSGQTLILLAPDLALPAELQGHVLVIDETLPDAVALAGIVASVYAAAGIEVIDPLDTIQKCVDALLGLPEFAAEQAMFLSLRKSGVDTDRLWDRKRQMVEATPGLSVWRGGETFEELRGVDNAVDYMRLIFGGENAPKAVVFIDEIEKDMQGQGDTSGTSADQLKVLLTYMQNNEARGLMFVGPPGAAKSAVAKAAGNDAGVPTIEMDLGSAKGSLVGQSEAQIRAMLKVVTAISGGQPLFIATSNNIAELPPELKRRFSMGTFFFDLPTDDDRSAIWEVYRERYDILASQAEEDFDDADWTGAEIKACARNASDLGVSLARAAAFIVPVAKSDAERIERLRREATGKYVSASQPGPYARRTAAAAPTSRQVRTRDLAD